MNGQPKPFRKPRAANSVGRASTSPTLGAPRETHALNSSAEDRRSGRAFTFAPNDPTCARPPNSPPMSLTDDARALTVAMLESGHHEPLWVVLVVGWYFGSSGRDVALEVVEGQLGIGQAT
jgi:hypothetical protein